ncbi:MAG: hypothetical protein ABWZ08_02760, partial [Pseudoxanthomonas sp.]
MAKGRIWKCERWQVSRFRHRCLQRYSSKPANGIHWSRSRMDWIGAKRRRANDARPPQRQTSLLSTLGAVGYLRTQLRFGLPILLACFVAQALYMAERAWQTPVTALWIPGPLLLGWLLIAPVRIWPTCLLGAGCGMAAATLLFAGPYGMAMLSITVDCTLTVACAWAML